MKLHILMVDDEAVVRELVSRYLRRHDCEVPTATTSAEAYRFVNESQVDLVVLDVMLGEDDGIKLLGAIKKVRPKLPVIMLTSIKSDKQLLQEAMKKGASAFLEKSIPFETLLMEIRRVLHEKREKEKSSS